jgi:hypothetical protein
MWTISPPPNTFRTRICRSTHVVRKTVANLALHTTVYHVRDQVNHQQTTETRCNGQNPTVRTICDRSVDKLMESSSRRGRGTGSLNTASSTYKGDGGGYGKFFGRIAGIVADRGR